MYHRECGDAGGAAPAVVHVHGFGISGTYLQPAAAGLTQRFRSFVPDLPGVGRSVRRERALDLPVLAQAPIAYCDEVGVDQATFVGNSLGCPISCEVAASSMLAFPTLERLGHFRMPKLLVAGARDPIVHVERVTVFAGLPHVSAVRVPGAHAPNFSAPDVVAALVEAHADGAPLHTGVGPLSVVEILEIPARP
jgi:pimeloyl-ACP methyl ester carboxylesterase